MAANSQKEKKPEARQPVTGNLCDLPETENAVIAPYYYTFTNFYFPMKEGKTLSVACSAGHTFQSGTQEEKITCTPEGWDLPAICFKKCIQPSLVNGIVHNGKDYYKTSETAQYSCFEGFTTKSGQKTEEIQCSSGYWDPTPECHQLSDRCVAPPLDNGIYTTTKRNVPIKEIVQYQCNPGYYTASGSIADWAECRRQGWSSTPRCTKSSCGKLANVKNGGHHPVKALYADRDVVQFFCKENYSVKGSALIQCYSYGWDPEPPTCEERKNRCPPPPRPTHSILLNNSSLHRTGDNVHYECNDNYKLIGTEQIHCENGQWTTPPTCIELKEKIKCDKPPSTNNGTTLMEKEVYYSGDSVFYKCIDGYELQGSNKIICKKGKWTEPPKCKANIEDCGSPPKISQGELTDTALDRYTSGTSVEYRCHSYHLMEGSKTIYCTQGIWSRPPICLEPCTASVEQMRERNVELQWSFEINSKFLHGDMVEFKCVDGFDLSAHVELKGLCQNGHILYPSCSKKGTLKFCGRPPVVIHGIVNPSQQVYMTGSMVVYQCSEHYYLNGKSTVHCSNGDWDDPPICIGSGDVMLILASSPSDLLTWSKHAYLRLVTHRAEKQA
ncbi:PREDICTED: coagulation factor XIII B chain [Nanorana parkeri]|uniref:coagulation factor XIII B chain n=1 Tax=Nanorana parkeri TaxID=125878 RepID=UPI000854E352|nr:PREDICTED: coagulation factor XIII B chain [Nanorana parkeri]